MFRIGVEFGHDVGAWSLAGQVPMITTKVRAVRRSAEARRRDAPRSGDGDALAAVHLAGRRGDEREVGSGDGDDGGAGSSGAPAREANAAPSPGARRDGRRGGDAMAAYRALGVDQPLRAVSRAGPPAARLGDREAAAAVGLFVAGPAPDDRQASAVQRAIAAAARRRRRGSAFCPPPDAPPTRVLATG